MFCPFFWVFDFKSALKTIKRDCTDVIPANAVLAQNFDGKESYLKSKDLVTDGNKVDLIKKAFWDFHTVDGRNPAPPGMYKTM